MRAALLGLSIACSTPDPAADRAAYLHALKTGSATACLAIEDPMIEGECVAATARTLPYAEASPACASIASPWSDECFFQLAEALPAADTRRRATCERAGQWAADCLAHLQARDVQAAWRAHDDPGAVHTDLLALHLHWFPDRTATERSDSTRAILARLIDQAHPPGPFDASRCGTAPVETCGLAYAHSQMRLPRERTYTGMCTGPITPELAVAARVRPWTSGSEPAIESAWALLCLRLEASGHLPPNIGPPPLIQTHRAGGRPGPRRPSDSSGSPHRRRGSPQQGAR